MTEVSESVLEHDHLREDIELIFRVYRQLACEVDHDLKNWRLGRLHYQLLLGIRRHPNEPANHYLSAMKITKQSMSRLIRELLEQGLIEERTGMRDRRERFLLLTDKGTELEQQLTDAQGEHFARLYKKVRPTAVARFREIMDILSAPSLWETPGAP